MIAQLETKPWEPYQDDPPPPMSADDAMIALARHFAEFSLWEHVQKYAKGGKSRTCEAYIPVNGMGYCVSVPTFRGPTWEVVVTAAIASIGVKTFDPYA